MRISDWSSDVCSSDLFALAGGRMGIGAVTSAVGPPESEDAQMLIGATFREQLGRHMLSWGVDESDPPLPARLKPLFDYLGWTMVAGEDRKNREKLRGRSEEHTSELQTLMRISYAVFCLKKKNQKVYTEQKR